jgi:hypothetical protein
MGAAAAMPRPPTAVNVHRRCHGFPWSLSRKYLASHSVRPEPVEPFDKLRVVGKILVPPAHEREQSTVRVELVETIFCSRSGCEGSLRLTQRER